MPFGKACMGHDVNRDESSTELKFTAGEHVEDFRSVGAPFAQKR